MTTRLPWETLSYSFKIDFSKPSFIASSARILHLEEKDVDVRTNRVCTATIESVASSESSSSEFAASVGLEASFGLFSTSASLGIDSSKSTTTKTMRTDSKIVATTASLTPASSVIAFPEQHLNEVLKAIIAEGTLDMPTFEDAIGHFYCRSCELGGVFEKSFIVEMASSDNSQSIETSLKASYGPSLCGVSAEASVGLSTSCHNENAQMRIEQTCLGGDTALWLAVTLDNQEEIKAQWAATVTDDNVFPLNTQLGYAWDLVKALNQQYGEKYEAYLKEKWALDEIDYDTLQYISESTPVIHGDIIKLRNQFDTKNGWLEAVGNTVKKTNGPVHALSNTIVAAADAGDGPFSRKGMYVTATSDPGDHNETLEGHNFYQEGHCDPDCAGQWRIVKSVDNFTSYATGEEVHAGDFVKLVNQYTQKGKAPEYNGWLDVYGELGEPDGGIKQGFNVECSVYENRDNGSGTWQVVLVRGDGSTSTNGEKVRYGAMIRLVNQHLGRDATTGNEFKTYLDVNGLNDVETIQADICQGTGMDPGGYKELDLGNSLNVESSAEGSRSAADFLAGTWQINRFSVKSGNS